jgi:hypothetical protein
MSMAGGKTKTEAKLTEARTREALFRGEDPRPSPNSIAPLEPTVSDLIRDYYQSPRFLNASKGWPEARKRQLENIIQPKFGKRIFNTLKKDQLFRLYMELKGNGFAHTTIQKYHEMLSVLGQLYLDLYPEKQSPIPSFRNNLQLEKLIF